MKLLNKKNLKYLPIILLTIFAVVLWYLNFDSHKSGYLKVVFLDVGQGDSIYIEAPNGKQMLVDGGGDSVVLSRLAQVMPFGDRSIDVVVNTNADQDHLGGLVEVLKKYKVNIAVESGVKKDTVAYKSFEEEIVKNKIDRKLAKRGMQIILDAEKNIYFDILFPDRDISRFESNDASVVGKLVYGNKAFMLTGDATKYTENLIMWNESLSMLKSSVLKLGHHGSNTSSSELWLEKVNPEVAIVSAGKNNKYGHPSKSTLDNLNKLKIPYEITYEKGNIVFETDGHVFIK